MSELTDRQHKTETEKLARLLKAHVIKIVLDSDGRLKKVDKWIAANGSEFDRFEAIRRLVDLGLDAKGK